MIDSAVKVQWTREKLKYAVLKLGDFGLVRQLSPDDAIAYTHLGTMLYMSPEVMADEGYELPTDMVRPCLIILINLLFSGH